MRLTSTQIATFRERGYLCPLDGFSPAEAVRNRQAFDDLLARFRRDGHDTYAINGYHTSCRSIYDMVMHPALLDAVESLVGPDFIAWGTHFFCKLPGDPKSVAWHQDAPYWPLAPMQTVTAWIAIDDVDDSNSAMRVIPGSHRAGPLTMRPSRPEENNVLHQTLDGPVVQEEPASIILRAGQFSLHSDLLVHGSLPNPSERRRCGLTVRYAPVTVRADSGWGVNAIRCRGDDPSGHWQFPTPPTTDEPRHGQRIIGAN